MRVFFDVFSGDELLSDSYRMTQEYNDVVIVVPSRLVVKGEENIDIGRGNEFGGGGEDEAVDNNIERVNEIIQGFNLQETHFTKKDYVAVTKAYMQKLRKFLNESNPDRVAGFIEGASLFIKWVVENFGEFKFYTGPSYDQSAMIVLSYYKVAEDEAPHFLYIKDGLRDEKY
jgi:Translationally controlled tumour protein